MEWSGRRLDSGKTLIVVAWQFKCSIHFLVEFRSTADVPRKCEVTGPLDENGYVVDFIALRDALNEIVKSLDHHVVLPAEHPSIKVADDGNEVLVTFESKRWIFPSEDCVILPLANTTAELMAHYIAVELKSKTQSKFGDAISKLIVAVDENRGQWGVCEMDW